MQIVQDEINKILGAKPLSKQEKAELEYLRIKHRDRILKSANAEDLGLHVEECIRKLESQTTKRSTPRQEQKRRRVRSRRKKN